MPQRYPIARAVSRSTLALVGTTLQPAWMGFSAGAALKQTVELLRHQFTDQRRSDARARTGPGWREGRSMFTYADGRPVRPEYLTHRFRGLIRQLDLPPIRLHDLRHGAATLAQIGRIASDASFGRLRGHALPAAQRAALRCRWPAGAPCGCGDLGLHGLPGSGATMMRLISLRCLHHHCGC